MLAQTRDGGQDSIEVQEESVQHLCGTIDNDAHQLDRQNMFVREHPLRWILHKLLHDKRAGNMAT